LCEQTIASLAAVTARFRDAMRLMRSSDRQRMEDGFHLLLPHAAEHVDELVGEFRRERDDVGLRRWLLELIGEGRSAEALTLLVEQLGSDDESLRAWAVTGLEKLGTRQARQELWRARANGLIG
jgi:HEAT repeats